jgi:hypothetical protein
MKEFLWNVITEAYLWHKHKKSFGTLGNWSKTPQSFSQYYSRYAYWVTRLTQFRFTMTEVRIKVAVKSRAQVWSRLIAGIAGSNPDDSMDVLLLFRWRPLWQADHSSRGALARACVCVIVCDLETSTKERPRPNLSCCPTEKSKAETEAQMSIITNGST